MKKPKLSIIVLSYNTKDLLRDCLTSLNSVSGEVTFEILVPDNGSIDGSVEMVEKEFKKATVIRNGENLGFAAGNNRARKYVKGEYVLFLNSDTVVYKNTLKKCVEYLEKHKDVGAVSCKVVLANGLLDKDTRRSFVTPWIGFTHIFLKIDRLFPRSKILAKYWYGSIPDDVVHEVDVIQGAFILTRKKLLDKIDWFDEDYFLDGEDIDLCWKIRQAGWKIMYYPEVKILHLKGASKGKNKGTRKSIPLQERMKYTLAGVNSMELFVKKRLWGKYPLLFNYFMLTGIRTVKFTRYLKLLAEK